MDVLPYGNKALYYTTHKSEIPHSKDGRRGHEPSTEHDAHELAAGTHHGRKGSTSDENDKDGTVTPNEEREDTCHHAIVASENIPLGKPPIYCPKFINNVNNYIHRFPRTISYEDEDTAEAGVRVACSTRSAHEGHSENEDAEVSRKSLDLWKEL